MFTSELYRKLEGLVQIGTIAEADHASKRLRVRYDTDVGDQVSAWLNWPAEISRNCIHWRPLRTGTQVIILAESGDLSNGVIVGMLYSSGAGIAAPTSSPDIDLIQFDDGTIIQYDSGASALTVTAVDVLNLNAQTLNINAGQTNWSGAISHGGGGVDTSGPLTCASTISATGAISSATTINTNGISLHEHTHRENGQDNQTDPPS